MANPQLLEFIKAEQALGKSQAEIIADLKASGWTDENINAEFATLQAAPTPTPPPQVIPQPQPQPQFQSQTQFQSQHAAPQHVNLGLKGIIITLVVFLLIAGGIAGFIYYKNNAKPVTPTPITGPNVPVPAMPLPGGTPPPTNPAPAPATDQGRALRTVPAATSTDN